MLLLYWYCGTPLSNSPRGRCSECHAVSACPRDGCPKVDRALSSPCSDEHRNTASGVWCFRELVGDPNYRIAREIMKSNCFKRDNGFLVYHGCYRIVILPPFAGEIRGLSPSGRCHVLAATATKSMKSGSSFPWLVCGASTSIPHVVQFGIC